MNVLTDFHHGALLRSIFYLFTDRLGFNLDVIDIKTGNYLSEKMGVRSAFSNFLPQNFEKQTSGGIDLDVWEKKVGLATFKDLEEKKYDLYIPTIPASTIHVLNLMKEKNRRDLKVLAFTGNDHMQIDESITDGLISSDEMTYRFASNEIPKIWTVQEIGRHFYSSKYHEITNENQYTIGCFINALPLYNQISKVNSITEGEKEINTYEIWKECENNGKFIFKSYGHGCANGSFADKDLNDVYYDSGSIWHFKVSEGWGHSLLQSMAAGRIVFVLDQIFKWKSAGKYLIPEYTAFHCDWNSIDTLKKIEYLTSDLDRMNEMSYRCWKIAQMIPDYEYEAERVKIWLEKEIFKKTIFN